MVIDLSGKFSSKTKKAMKSLGLAIGLNGPVEFKSKIEFDSDNSGSSQDIQRDIKAVNLTTKASQLKANIKAMVKKHGNLDRIDLTHFLGKDGILACLSNSSFTSSSSYFKRIYKSISTTPAELLTKDVTKLTAEEVDEALTLLTALRKAIIYYLIQENRHTYTDSAKKFDDGRQIDKCKVFAGHTFLLGLLQKQTELQAAIDKIHIKTDNATISKCCVDATLAIQKQPNTFTMHNVTAKLASLTKKLISSDLKDFMIEVQNSFSDSNATFLNNAPNTLSPAVCDELNELWKTAHLKQKNSEPKTNFRQRAKKTGKTYTNATENYADTKSQWQNFCSHIITMPKTADALNTHVDRFLTNIAFNGLQHAFKLLGDALSNEGDEKIKKVAAAKEKIPNTIPGVPKETIQNIFDIIGILPVTSPMNEQSSSSEQPPIDSPPSTQTTVDNDNDDIIYECTHGTLFDFQNCPLILEKEKFIDALTDLAQTLKTPELKKYVNKVAETLRTPNGVFPASAPETLAEDAKTELNKVWTFAQQHCPKSGSKKRLPRKRAHTEQQTH